jgi:peptide-methionine (S)-S-oxide reductase
MSQSIASDQIPADKEVATLGGGCFWCTEAAFDQLRGIDAIQSGYMGGQARNPSYESVCEGNTGHAEVVRLVFDPKAISYKEILEVFFTIHDPTTLNRQGNDVGTQYRSVIFYHSDEQRRIAEETMVELHEKNIWDDPLQTQVAPALEFWPAEDYHRDYYVRNPQQGYCSVVVAPKVAKVRQHFFSKLKK